MDKNQPLTPLVNQTTPPATQTSTTPQQQPPKNNNKSLIIGLVVGCLVIFIVIVGILTAIVLTSMNSSRSKAKDAQIKSNIQSLKNSAEIYNEINNTYKGWTADSKISSSIQQSGSDVVIQGLGDKTYVIYAKLPSNQKLYCIDSTGFSGEVSTISSTKTSCQ